MISKFKSLPKIYVVLLAIPFVLGCSAPSESNIKEALREYQEKKFGTKYLSEYSETVRLRESVIYGTSGGMALNRRRNIVSFHNGGDLRMYLLEYFKRKNYLSVEESKGATAVYGSLTEAGRTFLNNTDGIQEDEMGYKFHFYDQEYDILGKREIADGIYMVEYRIRCTPIKSNYIPQEMLLQRDIKKITERINEKAFIKRESKWAVKE